MAWQTNPETGESYQVEDPRPGEGTETGYQNHSAPGKPKRGGVPKFNDPNYKPPVPAGPVPPPAPAPPPVPPPPPTPGANGYTPTTAPYGFDQKAPGVQEQFWNNNQNMWFDTPGLDWVDQQLPQFADPWMGETWNQQNMGGIGAAGAGQQFWNGVQGQFNKMTPAQQAIQGGYKGPNNAQAAFGQTQSRMPGSLQPQFDAYYDRMSQKAMSNVNSQSAARGAYGSNTSLNNTIGAGLDIEAQRAKAATDFSLDNSANERQWLDSLSQQGRAADLSGQGAFGLNLDAAKYGDNRIKDFADIAFRSEQMDLDKKTKQSDIAFGIDEARGRRLDSGISTAFGSDQARQGRLQGAFNSAGQAQNAQERRVGGLYDDVTDFSQDTMSFFTDNYDKLIGADGQIDQAQMELLLGQTADARGYDDQTKERIFRDAKAVADFINGQKTADAAKPTGAG
jgi:hypothetical protein